MLGTLSDTVSKPDFVVWILTTCRWSEKLKGSHQAPVIFKTVSSYRFWAKLCLTTMCDNYKFVIKANLILRISGQDVVNSSGSSKNCSDFGERNTELHTASSHKAQKE